MKHRKGFTLAEILGVIVIIGLLLITPTIISRLGSVINVESGPMFICPVDYSDTGSRGQWLAQGEGFGHHKMIVSNVWVDGTNFNFHVRIMSNGYVATTGISGTAQLCFAAGENGTNCDYLIKGDVEISRFNSLSTYVLNEDFSVDAAAIASGEYRLIVTGTDYPRARFRDYPASGNGSYPILRGER